MAKAEAAADGTRQVSADDSILAELYSEHYTRLVRLAVVLVDDVETAEELVQDAFVRLHGRLLRVERDRAAAYLRASVVNGSRSWRRRLMVACRQTRVAAPVLSSAEDEAVGREQRALIIRAIRQLPRRQRECVSLRYYADLPESEIAATLDISVGSVKQHIHRAMRTLTTTLEAHR